MSLSSSHDWPITPLSSSLSVSANQPLPSLSTTQEKRIESIWASALTKHPTLYNGRVFCADIIEPSHIYGHWSEYRRVLAQMKQPDIYGHHPLRPLAVVGLMRVKEGVVIGRRSPNAIYLPHYWQGVPAGNVESRERESTINLANQLIAECQEELGLEPAECKIGIPLLACEHPSSHIVDIGLSLGVSLSFDELRQRSHDKGNAEYDALELILPHSPPSQNIVPTLKAMLERS
ncbi:hypothetical protein [Swingsia samuiensis]|uniref:Nudix hydrolase domain-containing protein n=1 Tax=Swingsia samuiensis TaxID=1293412 RepID=A0A4Y6UM73_9PROT|nr:hypothetical protein [Swingsia samuiensis]QDH17496.1 hypothetical protein E3D00_07925 [Swingsia samuiensis]